MIPRLRLPRESVLSARQVYDLNIPEQRPHVVLPKIWKNIDEMMSRGDPRGEYLKPRMKIAACGGDGTVAWVLKVVLQMNLKPFPALTVIPLGTG